MVMSVRDWAVRFGEASDRDPTIGAMARYFTCRYLWDMGPAKVIVEMRDGRVHSINTDPQPLDPYDFARFGRAPRHGVNSPSLCRSRCITASGRPASGAISRSRAISSS